MLRTCSLLLVLVLAASAEPPGLRPLGVVSGLGQALASRGADTRAPPGAEGRLPLPPLPSAQDLDAIKKVAQILVTLGQQVIPALVGGSGAGAGPGPCESSLPVDAPADPVADS